MTKTKKRIFSKTVDLTTGALGGYIATTLDSELLKLGFNFPLGSLIFISFIVGVSIYEWKEYNKKEKSK